MLFVLTHVHPTFPDPGNFGAVLEVHIRNRAEAIRRERAQDASTALRARHGLGPHTERPEEGGPYVQAPQPASQAQAQAQAAPPPSFARSRASASASENSASRGSGAPASAALRDMSQAIEGLAEAVRHMYLMQQETQRAIRQEVASAMHMYAQQQQHNGAPRMDETSLARCVCDGGWFQRRRPDADAPSSHLPLPRFALVASP